MMGYLSHSQSPLPPLVLEPSSLSGQNSEVDTCVMEPFHNFLPRPALFPEKLDAWDVI